MVGTVKAHGLPPPPQVGHSLPHVHFYHLFESIRQARRLEPAHYSVFLPEVQDMARTEGHLKVPHLHLHMHLHLKS